MKNVSTHHFNLSLMLSSKFLHLSSLKGEYTILHKVILRCGYSISSRLKILRNEDFFPRYLPKIRWGIVGFVDLSDYLCRIRVSWEFFSMLNSFLHSKMNSKQQKIIIRVNLYLQIQWKNHFVEQLTNSIP